jgi:hypothetical protein
MILSEGTLPATDVRPSWDDLPAFNAEQHGNLPVIWVGSLINIHLKICWCPVVMQTFIYNRVSTSGQTNNN